MNERTTNSEQGDASNSGWVTVDRQLSRAREVLASGESADQFRAVGLTCRGVLLSLAKTVYDPARHPSIDGVKIGPDDSRRMLESFLEAEIQNEAARKHARSALDFANSLLHSQTADYRRAAMCLEATSSFVTIIGISADRTQSHHTVGALCERFIKVKNPPASERTSLQKMSRSPIGKKVATSLSVQDLIEHAQSRRDQKMQPSTVAADLTKLRAVFQTARDEWGFKVSPEVIEQARRPLQKHKIISASVRRNRRITRQEIETLLNFFDAQEKYPRTKIPGRELLEFTLWSARRIGEIVQMRWDGLKEGSGEKICVLKGVRGPGNRKAKEVKILLLGEAWNIIQRQKSKGKSDYIFPFNEHSASQTFTQAIKACGIEDLRLQDFKREATKRLYAAGYSFEQIARATGRTDLNSLKKDIEDEE